MHIHSAYATEIAKLHVFLKFLS